MEASPFALLFALAHATGGRVSVETQMALLENFDHENVEWARRLYEEDSTQFMAEQLRVKYNLRDDAPIDFQILDESPTSVFLDYRSVDITDGSLVPFDVYSEGSDTDDVVDVFTVQCGYDQCGPGEDIPPSKNEDGGIHKVIKMLSGRTVDVVRVTDEGLFATIRSEYIDEANEEDLQVDFAYPPSDRRSLREGSGTYENRNNKGFEIDGSATTSSVADALASTYDIPHLDEIIADHQVGKNRRLMDGRGGKYRVIRLALRYDSGFCYQEGDSKSGAEAELRLIVADVSTTYQRQGLYVKVEICIMSGFCNGRSGSDPYRNFMDRDGEVCSTDDSLLERFRETEVSGNRWPDKFVGK